MNQQKKDIAITVTLALLVFTIIVAVIPIAFAASFPVTIPINATAKCDDTSCFNPSRVTISQGQEVTWTNNDFDMHTITSGNPALGATEVFDSGLLPNDSTFSHVFENSGDFEYFCTLHPWMQGIVVVKGDNPVNAASQTEPQSENMLKLIEENRKLRHQNSELQNRIDTLEKRIEGLNQIIMEQIHVIFEWVKSRPA